MIFIGNSSPDVPAHDDDFVILVAQCVSLQLLGRQMGDEELETIAQLFDKLHRTDFTEPEMLTPPQVAKLLRVNSDKVLHWIRTGELRAINVAAKTCGRPRYRVHRTDFHLFKLKRMIVPQEPVVRRKRKRSDVIEFF